MPVVLTPKSLRDCEPGELVRGLFSLNESVSWGIVGSEESKRRHGLMIISGKDAPWVLSPEQAAQTEVTCLSYGTEYQLLPEYGGACEVIRPAGQFSTGATLVYAKPVAPPDSSVIRFLTTKPAQTGFRIALNLDEFTFSDYPISTRAGFTQWSIWMQLPSCPPDCPVKIFEFERVK